MAIRLPTGVFYGQTQRRCEVAGLTFAESVYRTELHIPRHEHVNAFFYLILQGCQTEVFNGRSRTNGSGLLAFHPAGEKHSNRWEAPGGRIFHIEIGRPRLEGLCAYASFLGGPAEFHGGAAPALARQLYGEYQRADELAPLAMEGLTLELLAELSRRLSDAPVRRPPRWLLRAHDLLHDRFADRLALGEIAAAVGVHPVHLARMFRKQYACTLGDYARRLRVEFACRRLATTDTPLSHIALSAGFSDQSHFNKTFRRQMRMTPGEFRRTSRPR
jgi:AraC family transcriptional regulator